MIEGRSQAALHLAFRASSCRVICRRRVVADATERGLGAQPLVNPDYRFLLAANVEAVIMPWMVLYQQGAVVDEELGKDDLRVARIDTLVGAVVIQVIMIVVIIATAAARFGGL